MIVHLSFKATTGIPICALRVICIEICNYSRTTLGERASGRFIEFVRNYR